MLVVYDIGQTRSKLIIIPFNEIDFFTVHTYTIQCIQPGPLTQFARGGVTP